MILFLIGLMAQAQTSYLIEQKPASKIEVVRTLIQKPETHVLKCQVVELSENLTLKVRKVKK